MATEYIDITPTWRAIVPLLMAGIEAGSGIAREELYRMAELADRYVALEEGAINAEG